MSKTAKPTSPISEKDKKFIAQEFEFCPGNTEIFEKYYPDVKWCLMFRMMPHLIGSKMTKARLEEFIKNTQEVTAYKDIIADWRATEEAALSHMERVRADALAKAAAIKKSFNDLKQVAKKIDMKEEELDELDLESDEETDWHPTRIPEIAEYYIKSRIVAAEVTRAEEARDDYEEAQDKLMKIHENRPAIPAFMKQAFNKEHKGLLQKEAELRAKNKADKEFYEEMSSHLQLKEEQAAEEKAITEKVNKRKNKKNNKKNKKNKKK